MVDALLERGCDVVAIDNFVTGSKDNVAHLAAEPRFTLVEADLTDGPARPLPGRFDAILHMASPASPTDFAKLPMEILRVGSIGTLALLDRAVADGARFLMASTSEAYGDPLVHPQPESLLGQRQPERHPLGLRRVEAVLRGRDDGATTGSTALDTAIVRIFNTYGPRMRPDDGRAIPTFISQALRGAPLTVHGTGAQTRSITYVDDLVRGILLLLDSTETGPINCGTEHELTMLELAELIVRLTGSDSDDRAGRARRPTTRRSAAPT